MAVRNDISGLLAFIGRDDVWRARLQEVVEEHLGAALEAFGIDHEDLPDLLGEPSSGGLWGCGFEDFLGRRYSPADDNIVDLYLKRRGWKETVLNRAYFAALRDAPVSLYEVSDVKPGESMALRDLLREGAPVTVREKSATRSLRQWDRIVGRVVPERDHHVISGALLAFSADAVDLLTTGLRGAMKLKKREALQVSTEQLHACAPVFTGAWLFTELPRAVDPPQPSYCNSDGDEVMFHDLRFALASGVTQEQVAARLDLVEGLAPEGRSFWNWVSPRSKRKGKTASGIMLETLLGNGTVLGGLELKDKSLLFTVNSRARAAMAEVLVMGAAGDLLKPPMTTIRTVKQMMAERKAQHPRKAADEIPPDIAAQIARDYMDKHYRETLDAPLPALGGKTPRQAVRSEAGRIKVIDWLKLLENRSAGHTDGPIAEYDFSWIWAELGLQEHRK